ncbi:zinc transporter ZntB [Shewanella sp. JM162201]|uniref:Zinc transporter ZntB n=1 Tax=Shewanella jiangmenensis TaxID=2837387 RepID=A0ABS5V1G0_9GAMM|nr:zinc transporter ZntB [Shewanella jiangmenensis]MBT1444299.1 zinc transporter ZntB [Shewanella jiangmenensis]
MSQGFVHSLWLSGEHAGEELTREQLGNWSADQGCIWVHLNYHSRDAREWLQSTDLPKLEIDALLSRDTRPRAISGEGGLLLALRGVNLNPESAPEDMVALRLFADKSRVISTCRRGLQSVTEIGNDIRARVGPSSPSEVILALCERLTLRKTEFIDSLEEKLDDLEELVVSGNAKDLRNDIAELRRQTVTVRRYLAPQREAFSTLQTETGHLFKKSEQLRMREIRDRLTRAIEDLDALKDRASVTQEELMGRQSEELNTRLYFLSLVTAVFLPLGFLTGLLGVNIGGIPGADTPWAFAAFCGLLVLLVVVQLLLFYRKRWF